MKSSDRKASPLLAAAMSIVPGAGQVYAGSLKRGFLVLTAILAQAVVLLIAGLPQALPWLLLVWLWNMGDAARLAAGKMTSITIPVVILSLLNLILGWQASEIGTQIRQVDPASGFAQARTLMSALAKPDMFKPYRLQKDDVRFTFLPNGDIAIPAQDSKLELSTGSGDVITATGRDFPANSPGQLFFRSGGEKILADFKTDSTGSFRVPFDNPAALPGDYWITAEVREPVPVTQWQVSGTLQSSMKLMLETVFLAFLGTAISLLISLPLSFLAARNLAGQIPAGWALYSITRSAFNILRSIEVLIIAVIMAIIVGIGPLAGVLALAIHGIGALGKLYSEAIESIEHGPIEAVMSTGANWLQVVRYGAVPQVVPQFISFTMYRWDINVRMATVIGLVGGGGIGNLLMSYINSLQWEQAATAIWLIAVVVMLMDYSSAVIRERVV